MIIIFEAQSRYAQSDEYRRPCQEHPHGAQRRLCVLCIVFFVVQGGGSTRRAIGRDPTLLRSFSENTILGVQTASSLRETHQLRWGKGFEKNFSKGWVLARGPPINMSL